MKTSEKSLLRRLADRLGHLELEVYATEKRGRKLFTVCLWADDEIRVQVSRSNLGVALSRALTTIEGGR